MKITYIGHSGFFVEMQEVCFLFDYYKGKLPEPRGEKELIVFVSHRHEDHYNKEIFELIKTFPKVRFVLSKDVRTKWVLQEYREKGIDLEPHILTAVKNATLEMPLGEGGRLTVETLRSTDQGVAYLLTCGGKTIYHAGDLHLWTWEEESRQYNHNMTAAYFRELAKLKGRRLDAAFVPLDPRQGSHAFLGIRAFLESTESGAVFPMHFWGDYGIIERFLEESPQYREKIAVIRKEGQEFIIA